MQVAGEDVPAVADAHQSHPTIMKNNQSDTQQTLSRLRRQIVSTSAAAREGHVPSGLSILDIVWVMQADVIGSQRASGIEADRFVLSKGHGCLALYVALADLGDIPVEWLDRFGAVDGELGGHPDSSKVPGIEASTGSLGHGLPIGVGMALANRIRGLENRVVILIGDGEANEGSIWESAMFASHHGLGKVTCVVDHNHSTDRALVVDDLSEKFSSFGWHTLEIDGHDHRAIRDALTLDVGDQPVAVIAQTIKGRGVPEMENNPAWHHAFPKEESLAQLLESIE
jgi:transketolase